MTVLAPTPTSSAGWRERADGLFPGGANSPVRAYRAVGSEPPILVRGKGAYVWDADGRRYLDFVGGFGPHILGHAHPVVVRAVSSAARNGGPFGATHPSEILLAERIRAAMSSIEKLRFTSSGTEAVMSAIRVAKAGGSRADMTVDMTHAKPLLSGREGDDDDDSQETGNRIGTAAPAARGTSSSEGPSRCP